MLPTFTVIGAMKAGTTSLYHYLNAHPEIVMSKTKEVNFFSSAEKYGMGIESYEAEFVGEGKACGEGSVNYSKYPLFPHVPERMHKVLPGAKLIYIVRDPIERLRSQYLHRWYDGLAEASMEHALAKREKNRLVLNEEEPCIQFSRYHMQIEQYLRYYPVEQILITTTEELKRDPRKTMQCVFDFVGVDSAFYSEDFTVVHNYTSGKGMRRFLSRLGLKNIVKRLVPPRLLNVHRRMTDEKTVKPSFSSELRESLVNYFRSDVEKLRSLTGQRFPDWCV